ncbi:hypothetical protein SK128_018653, partial [Halocaridina rubra]
PYHTDTFLPYMSASNIVLQQPIAQIPIFPQPTGYGYCRKCPTYQATEKQSLKVYDEYSV